MNDEKLWEHARELKEEARTELKRQVHRPKPVDQAATEVTENLQRCGADVDRLINCDFFETADEEFREFVEQMPDTHWAKYDLSAVRLGWEAHKILSA